MEITGVKTIAQEGGKPGNSSVSQIVTSLFMLLIALTLAYATYNRNFTWKDRPTLWADVVSKSPMKQRSRNNYATALVQDKRYQEGLAENIRNLEINPNYAKAHFNIGAIYQTWGLRDKAIEEYKLSLAINPANPLAHNNLGYLYYSMGRLDEALVEFKAAIEVYPAHYKARINIGKVYLDMGRFEDAALEIEKALRYNPYYSEGHMLLDRARLGLQRLNGPAEGLSTDR